MSAPISDAERRQLVAEAGTDEGLDRALARIQSVLREVRSERPELVGAFRRTLLTLDEVLEPDDPVAVLVDRHRRGVVTRSELLADPTVRARLQARATQD